MAVTIAGGTNHAEQLKQVQYQDGVFVALDLSKGNAPKALRLYGIGIHDYFGEGDMIDRVHDLRERILTSDVFDSSRIIGVILVEDTFERRIDNIPVAKYLWERKQVVPFLRIDRGVAVESRGVQLMKEIPDLDDILSRAASSGILGTKARSVIRRADVIAIKVLVRQQFELAMRVLAKGLVPMMEMEVASHALDQSLCEDILLELILEALKSLGPKDHVLLRLSLPTKANLYKPLVQHPNVLRVTALSAGSTQAQLCEKLAQNAGVSACFCTAFLEGLHVSQYEEEFAEILDSKVESMYQASIDRQTKL